MGLRSLPDLTEREKALKKAKDSSKIKKDAAAKKKKATGDAVYGKYVNQYQREKDRTGINKKADTFFDKVGDKVRGSAVGKYAKSKGTGTFSRDDEAQMQARKDIKGYKKGGKTNMKKMNRGGMTAPMMGASGAPESGPKKPMIMPPKPKPAPRPRGNPIVDPRAKAPDPRMKDPRERGGAMPMMKKGGKVRGYGMARGGKACKMR